MSDEIKYDGPATVEIMRNSDKVIRHMEEGDIGLSSWSLGNYSCDCNRSDFFFRVAGEPEDDNIECGESKFSIRITSKDGRLMYSDGEFGFFDDDGKVPT